MNCNISTTNLILEVRVIRSCYDQQLPRQLRAEHYRLTSLSGLGNKVLRTHLNTIYISIDLYPLKYPTANNMLKFGESHLTQVLAR